MSLTSTDFQTKQALRKGLLKLFQTGDLEKSLDVIFFECEKYDFMPCFKFILILDVLNEVLYDNVKEHIYN